MKKIGIPRAMSFFYYYPFYKTFLQELGAEVAVSAPTTQKTLDRLTDCPTDEPCISVKLLFPHARELLENGVDGIFLPVLASGSPKSFFCPKHIGLPFMLKNALGINGEYVLSPRIDSREERHMISSFLEVAARLGAGRKKALDAFRRAEIAQKKFLEHTCVYQVTTPEFFCVMDGEKKTGRRKPFDSYAVHDPGLCTGIVAHSYTMYDFIGHNLVERLKEYGNVLTPEMVWPEDAYRAVSSIYEGEKLWTFEIQMVGSALFWLQTGKVDRLVFLGPFECGPEAIIESFLEKEAAKRGIPFLILTVDEQTGEAGLATRLEAFMDTAARPAGGITAPVSRDFSGTGRRPDNLRGRRKKTILGTPSMGCLNLVVNSIFNDVGIEVITPTITRETIKLGLDLAPEFICYPMVVTLGQMREALDNGANALFMVGGKGRCRLGWYSQVQENLLRKAGYDFDMIAIDTPFPLKERWKQFAGTVAALSNGKPWLNIAAGAWRGYQKALIIDDAMKKLFHARAVEKERGCADFAFEKLLKGLVTSVSVKAAKQCYATFGNEILSIPEEKGVQPYRIRVMGEIFVVLEDFVNMGLAKALGSQADRRVWIDREISATGWFRTNILRSRDYIKRHKKIERAASPYLNEIVGGHGVESVGLAALAREEGMDGVIHLFPFTCMPEIVAQNILTRVSARLNFPLLTLIINEQTGEAGIQTRLEAFMDIVEERRNFQGGVIKDSLLSGS